MGEFIAVDAAPATDWSAPMPAGLAPQLWAASRPTDATLAGLALPAGTAVHGCRGQLLGWESDPGAAGADLAALWLRCARAFPRTGLWPVCDPGRALEPGRIWHHTRVGEDRRPFWRDPYAVPSDVYDAEHCADRRDYFAGPGGSDLLGPLLEDLGLRDTGRELARASVLPDDPLAGLAAPDDPERLTLVACRRPADAVLLLDFGVANDSATPGIFAGVLRSWEARFGVVPVALRPGWTEFQVLAAPTDEAEAERLAAEVFAFAMDSAAQDGFYVRGPQGVVKSRAQEMVRAREWFIWWD